MGARLAVVMVCDGCTAELTTNESIYELATYAARLAGWQLGDDGECWCPDCVDADEDPRCRACGCTEANACTTPTGPCHWVEADLCLPCKTTSPQTTEHH